MRMRYRFGQPAGDETGHRLPARQEEGRLSDPNSVCVSETGSAVGNVLQPAPGPVARCRGSQYPAKTGNWRRDFTKTCVDPKKLQKAYNKDRKLRRLRKLLRMPMEKRIEFLGRLWKNHEKSELPKRLRAAHAKIIPLAADTAWLTRKMEERLRSVTKAYVMAKKKRDQIRLREIFGYWGPLKKG